MSNILLVPQVRAVNFLKNSITLWAFLMRRRNLDAIQGINICIQVGFVCEKNCMFYKHQKILVNP